MIIIPNNNADLPDGIKRFSWGAFLLTWIWAVGNKTWIGLLCFLPIVGFIMRIILGFKGREWAWNNKKWESVEHFNRVQRKWDIAGFIFAIVMGALITYSIYGYEEYEAKTKIVEILMDSDDTKSRVEEYIKLFGSKPIQIENAGFYKTLRYIHSVKVEETGEISIVLNFSPVSGNKITLSPTLDAYNKITWKCHSEDISQEYLPYACKK